LSRTLRNLGRFRHGGTGAEGSKRLARRKRARGIPSGARPMAFACRTNSCPSRGRERFSRLREPGMWTEIAAMADAFHDQLRAWDRFRVEATEFRELDDEHILALVRFRA